MISSESKSLSFKFFFIIKKYSDIVYKDQNFS